MAVFQDTKTKKWVVKIDTQRSKKRINHYKGGFERKSDALAYERAFLSDLDVSTLDYLDMSLQDVYEAYIMQAESNVKLTTLWKKKGFLRRYLFNDEEIIVKGNNLKLEYRLNRHMKIKDLTSQHLRKLKNELTSVDYSILRSHHKNQVLGEIRGLFEFSFREFSNIKQNVYSGVLGGTFSDENEIKKEPPMWDNYDFFVFSSAFNTDDPEDAKWYIIFLIIWTCHLRIGEVLGLRIMDYVDGNFYIRQAVVNGGGLGARATKPKSKTSERVVLIDSLTHQKLDNYFDYMTKLKDLKGESFNSEDYLFFFSERPLGRTSLRRKLKEKIDLVNELNMYNHQLSKMTIHGLRSSGSISFIDEIGNSRENMMLLQDRMGHAEMSVTMNHYLNRSKKAQQELRDRTDLAFSKLSRRETKFDK